MPRRRVLTRIAVVATVAAAVVVLPGPATSHSSAPRPVPPAIDTGPAEWVRQSLMIRTTVDTDGDGRRDRVQATLVRPPAADIGRRKLATIVWASPYFACCGPAPNHDVDVPLHVPGSPAAAPDAAGRFARTWVPRGYAVLLVASLGTAGSTGCPTIGTEAEADGVRAAIDWLNGRATARTRAGAPAMARWASGRAGMWGVSYDGTLANMVAATGVEGLDAIVPEASISSWYGYYRQDGLVVAPGGFQGEDTDVLAVFNNTRKNRRICRPVIRRLERDQDRLTGDYGPFWSRRDLLDDASRVRAAVLLTHGLADDNVRTSQTSLWYAALRVAGVERSVYFGPGGHGASVPPRLMRRWFDHYLYDVDNGVDRGPRAWVEPASGSVRTYPEWPAPDAAPVRFNLAARGGGTTGALLREGAGGTGSESFVDVRNQTPLRLARNPNPANGLVYLTAPAEGPELLSGVPEARLRLTFDQPAANVTAGLVLVRSGTTSLISIGWTDPQNRNSPAITDPVTPGTAYDLVVRMQAEDIALRAGDRLGLVVLSTDVDHTLRPPVLHPELTLDLAGSHLSLPLAPLP